MISLVKVIPLALFAATFFTFIVYRLIISLLTLNSNVIFRTLMLFFPVSNQRFVEFWWFLFVDQLIILSVVYLALVVEDAWSNCFDTVNQRKKEKQHYKTNNKRIIFNTLFRWRFETSIWPISLHRFRLLFPTLNSSSAITPLMLDLVLYQRLLLLFSKS